MNQDINVLALVKGDERVRLSVRRRQPGGDPADLGTLASNPELSFTWYDAAVLSQKIRQESRRYRPDSRFNVPQHSDLEE